MQPTFPKSQICTNTLIDPYRICFRKKDLRFCLNIYKFNVAENKRAPSISFLCSSPRTSDCHISTNWTLRRAKRGKGNTRNNSLSIDGRCRGITPEVWISRLKTIQSRSGLRIEDTCKTKRIRLRIGSALTPSELLELNWLSIIPAVRHSLVCRNDCENQVQTWHVKTYLPVGFFEKCISAQMITVCQIM
jgi:hypothetical protein